MSSLWRETVRRITDGEKRATALEEAEWVGPVRGCLVIRTTAATINDITLTTVAFSTALWDLGACWSPAVSTRLIAPRDGYYVIGANIGWANAADADGTRILQIVDNDGNTIASVSQHGSTDAYVGQTLQTPGPVHMAAGDYAVIKVYQSSGAAKKITTASVANPYWCQASIIRMH